jgi:hypothetical protein
MTGAARRSFSSLCLTIALATLAPHASAQTEEDRAAARALATQGIARFNEGRHAEALDLFTRAESLLHAPPHVLYQARAAAKLGQLVRARELYLKLTREELAASAPPAFRDAQNEARNEVKAIEPRLANITISVKAPAGVQFKLEMDKKPVSTAVVGVPFPADPGKHQLMASAPGYQSKLVEVTLAEGGRGAADLALEPTGVAAVVAPGAAGATPATTGAEPPSGSPIQPAPPAATASVDQKPAASGSPAWMRPVSYVALGVGVVGLGFGTYFGLKSRSERNTADDLASQCGARCLNSDPLASQIDAKDNSAKKKMTLSIVSFVVGGVGVATGTTLFVLSSRKPTQSARTVTPFIGWGSAGLGGTW